MFVEEYLDSLFEIRPSFSLVSPEKARSTEELRENSLRLIPSLRDLGLRSGDVVIVSLPNRIEFFELLLACFYSGIIPLLANPKLPNSEIARLKMRANAKITISSFDQFRYSLGSSLLKLPSVRTIDEPAIYLLSSGTTGDSKIIVHSLSTFFGSAQSFGNLAGYNSNSRLLHNWPMIYMAGIFNLFAVPMTTGSTVVVLDAFGPSSMTSYWEALDRFAITDVLLTPTMAASLSRVSRYTQRENFGVGLASMISTSSPLYPSVYEKFRADFGLELSSCYGITEFGGSLTLANPPFAPEDYCVGRWIPEADVSVHAETGEVFIKTPFMALRYLLSDGSTQELGPDRFHGTGDYGAVKDSELLLTGRLKDTIKRGGVPISMTDVEDLVLRSGFISDAVGLPQTDEYWGEVYELQVIPAEDVANQDCENELWRYLNRWLPDGAYPERIRAVESIEKTVSGKSVRFKGSTYEKR